MVRINLDPTAKIIANFDKRTQERKKITQQGHQNFPEKIWLSFLLLEHSILYVFFRKGYNSISAISFFALNKSDDFNT